MLNLPVQTKNNVQVMSSVDLAKLCVGDSKDAHSNFMKKAERVLGDTFVNFYEREVYNNNNTRNILLLPEREACLMAMSYSYELQAYVFDEWQRLKNKSPQIPQTKLEWIEFALEQEKQLELKTEKVEQLESLFHSGGTIAQFSKQMNGVNSQQINNWIYENTNWLYDENKGKVYSSGRKQGQLKSSSWRCASYARDKYLTERPYSHGYQGQESITKYEVQLLACGKKWLFDKYIAGKLPMKSNWDGEFAHKKDLF